MINGRINKKDSPPADGGDKKGPKTTSRDHAGGVKAFSKNQTTSQDNYAKSSMCSEYSLLAFSSFIAWKISALSSLSQNSLTLKVNSMWG
ncbi:hypothetical protein D3Z58_05235 [Clostridiaceae bacterium]|nr:hypothetical protein [Clostridiaceae bacterium]